MICTIRASSKTTAPFQYVFVCIYFSGANCVIVFNDTDSSNLTQVGFTFIASSNNARKPLLLRWQRVIRGSILRD